MEEIRNQKLTGERALFMSKGLSIRDSIFLDGESPLKECHDISVEGSSFQWKYPLWYCSDVRVRDCTFFEMARAGIWYTENISMKDCLYQAPKGLRRVRNLELEDVDFPHADETLWYCSGVSANSRGRANNKDSYMWKSCSAAVLMTSPEFSDGCT